ncbi:hypothetical protein GM708_07575 [Vibrio cholerae]|nr:hypothetical protein [Vibrio cholerae]
MTIEVTTTTAQAAKHATRAFAQAISLDEADLSAEQVKRSPATCARS